MRWRENEKTSRNKKTLAFVPCTTCCREQWHLRVVASPALQAPPPLQGLPEESALPVLLDLVSVWFCCTSVTTRCHLCLHDAISVCEGKVHCFLPVGTYNTTPVPASATQLSVVLLLLLLPDALRRH